MQDRISKFREDWFCFSNFYPSAFVYEGRLYPTSEHAYQAARVNNIDNKTLISNAKTPVMAKRLGRKFHDRDDWRQVNLGIMTEIVKQKFSQNKDLMDILLSTDDALLEEGNSWNDTFWGVCKGRGENNLGKILMNIRSEFKANGQKV